MRRFPEPVAIIGGAVILAALLSYLVKWLIEGATWLWCLAVACSP